MLIEFKNSGLNQMLNERRVLAFNDPSREFQLYLEDHRNIILATSTKRWLTYDETELYNYRPVEFLISISYPVSGTWYVLWLNQIKSYMDFKDIEYLYIPNHKFISSTLYERFRSELSLLKGNDSKFFED